ncbi:MAG: hypothetical protein EOO06_00960 [Chitinophagaceae bacterium]|nr:MAG: hypothetical protein EOO06_00960 [Chitinophagaceae bacterium]
METQDWEGKDLDKDLLIRGNQVYSPETCVFIDQKVNKFISEKLTNKKAHLIGAYFLPKRGKFKSVSYDVLTGKQKHLGNYNTEEEAHNAWLSFKLEQAHILAAQQSDQRVAKALVNRYKNYLILEDN